MPLILLILSGVLLVLVVAAVAGVLLWKFACGAPLPLVIASSTCLLLVVAAVAGIFVWKIRGNATRDPPPHDDDLPVPRACDCDRDCGRPVPPDPPSDDDDKKKPDPPAIDAAACIPDDGQARPLRTEDGAIMDGYEQITGLCGRDKFALPGWQHKYDRRITPASAQGTIPTYNTDVHPDGNQFCDGLDEESCKTRIKRDGYVPRFLCHFDKSTAKCHMKSWGFVQETPKNAPIFYTPRLEPLNVDFTTTRNMDVVAENFHCLHKVWGAGGSNDSNHGVHKDNIWLDVRGEKKTKYLVMQFQGDLATSGSLGIRKTNQFTGEGDNCKKYVEMAPDEEGAYTRVGAILATKYLYGSGSFEIEAMVPQANEDEDNDGMGYVFAMWTFGYTEMYPIADKKLLPANQQLLDGNMTTPWFNENKWDGSSKVLTGDDLVAAQNYQSCGPGTTIESEACDNSFTCGKNGNCSADGNDAPYTSWVSEIDIEIPANPQANRAGVAWKTDGGHWSASTINFNTWRGDDEDYGPTSPYHQQCIRGPSPFRSKSANEFRKYRFDWYAAGPDGFGRVEFYIDGKHMYTSKRYVPSRIARFVFGPWFGWWGGKSNFDKKEVWVKSVRITPFTESMGGDRAIAARNNVAYPQTFDQCNPDATHTQLCDFKALDGNRCEPDVCAKAGLRRTDVSPCETHWQQRKLDYYARQCNLPDGTTDACKTTALPVSK